MTGRSQARPFIKAKAGVVGRQARLRAVSRPGAAEVGRSLRKGRRDPSGAGGRGGRAGPGRAGGAGGPAAARALSPALRPPPRPARPRPAPLGARARARRLCATHLARCRPRRENASRGGSARGFSDWPPPSARLPIGRVAPPAAPDWPAPFWIPNSKFLKVPGEGGRALTARGRGGAALQVSAGGRRRGGGGLCGTAGPGQRDSAVRAPWQGRFGAARVCGEGSVAGTAGGCRRTWWRDRGCWRRCEGRRADPGRGPGTRRPSPASPRGYSAGGTGRRRMGGRRAPGPATEPRVGLPPLLRRVLAGSGPGPGPGPGPSRGGERSSRRRAAAGGRAPAVSRPPGHAAGGGHPPGAVLSAPPPSF